MLIKITTDQGRTIQEVEEATLQRRDDILDNENETTKTVEYCFIDCSGVAHKTGYPDSISHFCNKHVHRSASVVLKKGLLAEATAGQFPF